MRKIDPLTPDTPIWKRWRTDCDKATAKLLEQVAEGAAPEISELYSRKSIKGSFFFSKGPPFYGKCAYCEAPVPDYQRGDVDHFRPKAGVTDEDDRPIALRDDEGEVEVDEDGNPVPHPGYYWLAYDWRNLLPTCTICNQPKTINGRKVGKRNRFPVQGRHAQAPGEEARETPYLIHPANGRTEDDPDRHLRVDTKTGFMCPLDERGKKCIEIFGLNLRDQLVDDRKRACREIWHLLGKLAKPGGDPDAIRELAEIRAGKRTFTMAQRAVLKEFKKNVESVFWPSSDGPPGS